MRRGRGALPKSDPSSVGHRGNIRDLSGSRPSVKRIGSSRRSVKAETQRRPSSPSTALNSGSTSRAGRALDHDSPSSCIASPTVLRRLANIVRNRGMRDRAAERVGASVLRGERTARRPPTRPRRSSSIGTGGTDTGRARDTGRWLHARLRPRDSLTTMSDHDHPVASAIASLKPRRRNGAGLAIGRRSSSAAVASCMWRRFWISSPGHRRRGDRCGQ